MSLSADTVGQLGKMLGNLDNWLAEAASHAEARGWDPELFLTARLAPDQFDLTRNAQAACDAAKLAAARLADVEAPKHEDGPCTLAELRARIAEVQAFLADLDTDVIDASGDRILTLSALGGQRIRCEDYARDFAIPNAYFHFAMVYAILRDNGVPLGKRTWIGRVALLPPEPSA